MRQTRQSGSMRGVWKRGSRLGRSGTARRKGRKQIRRTYSPPRHTPTLPIKAFEVGSWGGEFNPEFGPQKGDVIIKEHWAQSGFANTDLDVQLKQHGIQKIILVGVIANSCIESTGRFGMELGYHVTLVRDATAAFSVEGMKAAET